MLGSSDIQKANNMNIQAANSEYMRGQPRRAGIALCVSTIVLMGSSIRNFAIKYPEFGDNSANTNAATLQTLQQPQLPVPNYILWSSGAALAASAIWLTLALTLKKHFISGKMNTTPKTGPVSAL